MPTNAERQALAFLAAVAVMGTGVRIVGAKQFAAQASAGERLAGGPSTLDLGARALAAQLAAVDSAQQDSRASGQRRPRRPRGSRASGSRPFVEGEQAGDRSAADTARSHPLPVAVNLNSATVRELERLPRVGPALAQRIVAWREEHGRFRSLEDLRHVRGIGPVTAALLAPSVTF